MYNIQDVKNWISLCWSWDSSPVQKGKRAQKKSQTLTTGRVMDFAQKDRNRKWNTEIFDILPYGEKPSNSWPWCEATFTELVEHKVHIYSVCADTPAMSDIMCHIGHKSPRGCPYGWCRGKQVDGDKSRVAWLVDEPPCRIKTEYDYELFGTAADARGEEIHGFTGKSPLLLLGRSVVRRCDADFAHDIGYGIVLRYMLPLFKGKREIAIYAFRECKNTPRTPAEKRKEEEREKRYKINKEKKLRYREQDKLFMIPKERWKEMDASWLRFCADSGYSTTAVPFGDADSSSTKSRMTMHECIKYAVNCYTDAKEIGIPPPYPSLY